MKIKIICCCIALIMFLQSFLKGQQMVIGSWRVILAMLKDASTTNMELFFVLLLMAFSA